MPYLRARYFALAWIDDGKGSGPAGSDLRDGTSSSTPSIPSGGSTTTSSDLPNSASHRGLSLHSLNLQSPPSGLLPVKPGERPQQPAPYRIPPPLSKGWLDAALKRSNLSDLWPPLLQRSSGSASPPQPPQPLASLSQSPGTLSDSLNNLCWPDCSPPGSANITQVTRDCLPLRAFLEVSCGTGVGEVWGTGGDIGQSPDSITAVERGSDEAKYNSHWQRYGMSRATLSKFWKVLGQ